MEINAFFNGKGGVGKTASAIVTSHMLSTVYKKKTLLIDMDPQGNSSSLFSNTNVVNFLVSLLKGQSLQDKDKSVEDLLMYPDIDIHDCIQNTKYENLDIIPSLLTLSECEEALKADIRTPQQFRLKHHLDKIQDEYDYCIIDCSPSVSLLNINALATSDKVYIPLKCDAWSAVGMCIAKNLIKTVQSYNPRLKLAGCFFTQWEGIKNISKTTHELLTAFVPELVLPVTIAKSKLIEEMSYKQMPLIEYDTAKEKSKVTRDYLALTEYIINH